jgi:hypothetical protein
MIKFDAAIQTIYHLKYRKHNKFKENKCQTNQQVFGQGPPADKFGAIVVIENIGSNSLPRASGTALATILPKAAATSHRYAAI